MLEAKPVTTPLVAHFKLSSQLSPNTKDEVDYMSKVPYANAVGCLMYMMVCTRPDLSQVVSVVSRYMENPGKKHWNAIKWILKYLAGTRNSGIMFDRSTTSSAVVGYVDANYAGDLDSRKSMTGYVFTFAGGAISWKSILQDTVARTLYYRGKIYGSN